MVNSIPITFSDEEIAYAIDFIDELTRDKITNSVNDLKFDKNNSSYAVNLMGYLGEMAAAKVLNLKTDRKIRTHGDDGFDLKLNSETIQVKTSTLSELIFNRLNLFKADLGLLVQLEGDKTRPHVNAIYHVIGYIKKDDFLKNYKVKNYGYGDRYTIGAARLNPIQELMPM